MKLHETHPARNVQKQLKAASCSACGLVSLFDRVKIIGF